MRAAIRRRHRVGVGREETVGIRGPGYRPFAGAMRPAAARLAGEDVWMHQRVGVDRRRQIVLEAAGEMEARFGRNVLDALEELRVAAPANLDAAEQIGL